MVNYLPSRFPYRSCVCCSVVLRTFYDHISGCLALPKTISQQLVCITPWSRCKTRLWVQQAKSFILDCETTQEPQEQHQLQVSENKPVAHTERGTEYNQWHQYLYKRPVADSDFMVFISRKEMAQNTDEADLIYRFASFSTVDSKTAWSYVNDWQIYEVRPIRFGVELISFMFSAHVSTL